MQRKLQLLILLALIFSSFTFVYAQDASVQARVTPILLNVREAPGPTGGVIGTLDAGAVVNVTGRAEGPGSTIWVFVTPTAGGPTGWVMSEYLEFPTGLDLTTLPVLSSIGAGGATGSQPANNAGGTTIMPGTIDSLPGTTLSIVNFRAGPGTNFGVIREPPVDTRVTFIGRNSNATWFLGVVDGQQGWLARRYVDISSTRNALPVVEGFVAEIPAGSGTAGLGDLSSAAAPPLTTRGVVPSSVSARVREIFAQGQQMGNQANVFSKVGDSITLNPLFLTPIGYDAVDLGNYSSLQATIDFFNPASFTRQSVAARNAWRSDGPLDPGQADPNNCLPGEIPLTCEYRIMKPAVALIMIGTNDVQNLSNRDTYRANLAAIVQITIDNGVIPVLSTIPDNLAHADVAYEINDIIKETASYYQIPLLDYWQAMQGVPGGGLDPDGIHPSYNANIGSSVSFVGGELNYGYAVRNLTTLQMLDVLRRQVLS